MANVHVGERQEVDVMVEMEGRASSESRSMVEECMLLAGEAAARCAYVLLHIYIYVCMYLDR